MGRRARFLAAHDPSFRPDPPDVAHRGAGAHTRLVRAAERGAPGARPQHIDLLDRLLSVVSTAGNLTTDAHLAALAIEHQCELHSSDGDFAPRALLFGADRPDPYLHFHILGGELLQLLTRRWAADRWAYRVPQGIDLHRLRVRPVSLPC
jgi:hypothetical protein